MSAETLTFQAETARLLELVATALYSNKEVFVRELVSNAADATDKLRYLNQTDASLLDGQPELQVTVTPDPDNNRLTFTDTGIGMNRDELIENLGTIAKSGTKAFMDHLKSAGDGDGPADTSALIGQFGVGFYSAFVVADSVSVTSRRAGEDKAHRWTSDGKGAFSIEELEGEHPRGTQIELTLKEDAAEFANDFRLRNVIERYANHIAIPVYMETLAGEPEDAAPADDADDGDNGQESQSTIEQINKAQAIWRRSAAEVDADAHKEFYQASTGMFDEPWDKVHLNAEGALEYHALLYLPSTKPFDLYNAERKNNGVKLYVKRVFITDETEELMPSYLRFVRGVVDSEDLPLNVSRELLQASPILSKMKDALTKRVLNVLKKRADKDAEGYSAFYETFGAVLKEGLYEDFMSRDKLLPLVRFKSSEVDGWTSLADYISRMKEGQDKIYYINAESEEAAASSAHLEGFKARGLEVLYAVDPVDSFWIPSIGMFEEKQFESVTQGSTDLSNFERTDAGEKADESKENIEAATDVIAKFKTALGERVSDVRLTDRLDSSAVCLVAGETGADRRLEKILASHNQAMPDNKPVLEVNPNHALIKALPGRNLGVQEWEETAALLFDVALVQEGELPSNPADFARKIQGIMGQ